MDKLDLVGRLTKLKYDVENLVPYHTKGRKGFLNRCESVMDFIESHRVEQSLNDRMFKELFDIYNSLMERSETDEKKSS